MSSEAPTGAPEDRPQPAAPPAPPAAAAPAAPVEDEAEDREEEDEDEAVLPLSPRAAAQLLEREMEARPAPQPQVVTARGGSFGGAALIAASILGSALGLAWLQRAAPAPQDPVDSAALELARTLRDLGASQREAAQDPGQLAPYAGGKALYADGRGRFLVLAPDPQGGDIQIERVLQLVEDPTRLHGSPKRAPHGYYLEDVGEARAERVRGLLTELEAEVASGRRDTATLARVSDLARRAAHFHAVEALVPYLSHERFFVRQAAALALCEQGYLAGLSELIYSFDIQDEALRRHIAELCLALTGQPFITEPSSPNQRAAMDLAREWLNAHPLESPYARGRELLLREEDRLRQGMGTGG